MNSGRKAEKFVRLIQETIKDFPGLEIFSNYKIKNISGRNREIDVLLKTTINSFEIIIAIECKDYKISIPVEKIESFNSKCQRITGISKKIFVATNGFQADAINAAKHFDIELYNLNEIESQDIINWFPIKQLKAKYLLKPPHGLEMDANESEIVNIPKDDELTIHFYDGTTPKSLTAFLWNSVIVENQRQLKVILLYDFMKYDSNLNYQTIIPFKVDINGIYILGENDKKINITRIESAIVGWLEETPAKIIGAKSYKKWNSETIADIVSIDMERGELADIVFTKEKDFKIFHTDDKGKEIQLQTLFEFDSKTNKLTKKNRE
ncbi:MAG: restriction endonuclease [Draconibacterium sp.]